MEKSIKKSTYDFIYSPVFEIWVIVCIITSVSFLIIDNSIALNPQAKWIINQIALGLNIFFVIEYLARISIAPSKWIFFRKNLIDFIALLPILRIFRMVRILRLIRIIKILKVSRLGQVLAKKSASFSSDLQGKTIEGVMVGFILFAVVLMGSVGILVFEKGQNEHFQTFLDGFWWSIVTLTTVGYGDKFPITFGGRILAVVIMLLGLSFFALVTGFVSSFIIQRYRKEEYTGMDLIGVTEHVIICGWNSNATTVVEELVSLYKDELTHFVIIAEEQPEFVFTENVHFVKGDFTKKEILNRAQIESATSVIVLADSTAERSEQDIDARTVLASLAIEKIKPEIYTCVEILSPENKEHVVNAGVDEYIISANYTGNLLAHSVKNPGITKVYNELLRSTEGNQIYKVPASGNLIGRLFRDCAIELLQTEKGILIGLERNNEYMINPSKIKIESSDTMLLIARQETAI